MKLVAFSGYARAGKDTAVQVLRTEGFKRVAFADVMRDFALRLNPIVSPINYRTSAPTPIRLQEVIDDWGWEHYKETKYSREIRGLLQRLGTECGRELIGENVWVDAALNGLDPDGMYAVSDCRFVNEAEAVRARGGKVIRINRPGVGPANSHSSETGLDDYRFDAVVSNDDSHEVLRQRLLEVIWRE